MTADWLQWAFALVGSHQYSREITGVPVGLIRCLKEGNGMGVSSFTLMRMYVSIFAALVDDHCRRDGGVLPIIETNDAPRHCAWSMLTSFSTSQTKLAHTSNHSHSKPPLNASGNNSNCASHSPNIDIGAAIHRSNVTDSSNGPG